MKQKASGHSRDYSVGGNQVVPHAPEFGDVFKLQGLGAGLGSWRHGVGGKNRNRSLPPGLRDLQRRPCPSQLPVRSRAGNRSWASSVRRELNKQIPEELGKVYE